MTHIAMLGLGAMGTRMARRLLAAGHTVTVWNRSAAAAGALEQDGARVAASPRAAAAAAEVVISMVFDDDAAHAVWLHPDTGALAGMASGAVGIESSTLSPGLVRELHARARQRGLAFVDAPVAGSRPQAEAGALIFMAGGDRTDVERVEPVLLAMGSAVHYAGPAGSGAVVKLMVNALFGAQLAALAEWLGVTAKAGVDPASALAVLAATPVASPAVRLAGAAMLAREFAPAAPIDLIAKDLALAAALGAAVGQATPVTSATGAVVRAAAAAGDGARNITAVVRRYLE